MVDLCDGELGGQEAGVIRSPVQRTERGYGGLQRLSLGVRKKRV